jgi:hypothetical protein
LTTDRQDALSQAALHRGGARTKLCSRGGDVALFTLRRATTSAASAAKGWCLLTHVLVNDVTGLPWKNRQFIVAFRAGPAHAAKATGRAAST